MCTLGTDAHAYSASQYPLSSHGLPQLPSHTRTHVDSCSFSIQEASQVINLEDIVATSQNFVDMDAAQLFVRAQEEDIRKLTPEKNLLTEYHTFEVLQVRTSVLLRGHVHGPLHHKPH